MDEKTKNLIKKISDVNKRIHKCKPHNFTKEFYIEKNRERSNAKYELEKEIGEELLLR